MITALAVIGGLALGLTAFLALWLIAVLYNVA
jgi:hypothetical protein